MEDNKRYYIKSGRCYVLFKANGKKLIMTTNHYLAEPFESYDAAEQTAKRNKFKNFSVEHLPYGETKK